MKCKRIRKMLPLFIGSDLSSRKMSLIRSHLERCRSCRMEYERYVKSKEVLTGWMQEKEAEWNECEWRDSISRSVPPSHRDRTALAPWPFKKIWAYAFMVLAAFV
ncbi:MAG: zf-HC2 domain-containing protein, partial [Candidatus Aminicenantes bacterium]|nr:zf-HC2 domain-containing protein [Candidatus Aminicenantes bacterium]